MKYSFFQPFWMWLRRRKMLAMMIFGILITNYEDPIVMTCRDVFKRFMFTWWISLKRHKMKRKHTFPKQNKQRLANKDIYVHNSLHSARYKTDTPSPGIIIFLVRAVSCDWLNTAEAAMLRLMLRLNIVALIMFPNITVNNKQWIYDGLGKMIIMNVLFSFCIFL